MITRMIIKSLKDWISIEKNISVTKNPVIFGLYITCTNEQLGFTTKGAINV